MLGVLAVFLRLGAAIVAAALVFSLARSLQGPLWLRVLRLALAAFFAVAAVLLVLLAIPAARLQGLDFVSGIATAIFIAGLVIEALIGSELRKALGLEGAAKP